MRYRTVLAGAALACLASAAVPEKPLRFACRPGQRIVYVQSYRTRARSDARVLFDAGSEGAADASLAMDLELELRGRMVVEVADADAGGFLLLVHWEALAGRVESKGQVQAPFLETLRSGLARPLLARLEERGRFTRVWLDPQLDPAVAGTARLLLAQLQCILPEGGERAWTTLEADAAGQFEVHYERDPGRGRVRIRKRLAAERTGQAPPVVGQLQVEREVRVEGTRRILFDANAGLVDRLDAREVQGTRVAGKVVAASESRFSLRRAGLSRSGPGARQAAADLRSRFPGTELFVALSPREQEEIVQRKELGAVAPEEPLAALQAAEARGETDGRPYYLKLKALASLHPEACAAMGRRLESAAAEGLAMRTLASALGTAGTPAAQAALAGAIRRRREDWPAQAVLIPALGQCVDPEPDSIALLEELAYGSMQVPVASTAQLMLGTMAFNLARQGAQEKAARIVTAALARLEQADSTPLVSRFLLCLGNAGSSKALPALKSWAAAAEPELRAVAVFALRWIEDPEVDAMLLRVLADDPAPEVRLRAVDALKFRSAGEAAVAALTRAAIGDGSPRVRQAALGSLWDLRAAHPAVRAAVEAARDDPDEDVRALARSLLGEK